ncbi:MAG: hypothetical protein ACXACI_16040, partial [Candidatus Hodarchaeales archaeon]
NRSDLIIYWGANPIHAHPRHLSRYSLFPRGYFRERGRRNASSLLQTLAIPLLPKSLISSFRSSQDMTMKSLASFEHYCMGRMSQN